MKKCFLIFAIFFLGCNSKKTSVDIFFKNLDASLLKQQKEEIKNCPDVGCLWLFAQSKAKSEFLTAYNSVAADINSLLADSFKIDRVYDRQRALVLAYQKKLSNQKINFSAIKNELIQYDQFQEKKYFNERKKEIQTQSQLAQQNFNKFRIGDTITLLYPLEKNGSVKSVYFPEFYYKKDYSDTLFLKCILVKKEIGKRVEGIDSNKIELDDFTFTLKILEAKNKEIDFVHASYRKGNTIVLPLYVYGRDINR